MYLVPHTTLAKRVCFSFVDKQQTFLCLELDNRGLDSLSLHHNLSESTINLHKLPLRLTNGVSPPFSKTEKMSLAF